MTNRLFVKWCRVSHCAGVVLSMGATLRIVRIVNTSSPNNVRNAKGGTYPGWAPTGGFRISRISFLLKPQSNINRIRALSPELLPFKPSRSREIYR